MMKDKAMLTHATISMVLICDRIEGGKNQGGGGGRKGSDKDGTNLVASRHSSMPDSSAPDDTVVEDVEGDGVGEPAAKKDTKQRRRG